MNHDARPLVSVIVPVFNAEGSLRPLFESLLAQTYPHQLIEIVLVDNGSTDGSVLLLKEFSDASGIKVKLVDELIRQGSYAARNKGIDHSNGDILAFTDADCIPNTEWISNAVRQLSDGGSATILGGKVELVTGDRQKPTAVEMFEMIFAFPQKDNITKSGYSVTANMITWRSAFASVGLFDSKLRSKGDFDWCIRAREHGYQVTYADDVCVTHPARSSLKEIILKTRRVTGGQMDINPAKRGFVGSAPRGLRSQISLIKSNTQFTSFKQRAMVFGVSAIVLVVKVFEKIRLNFGAERERR